MRLRKLAQESIRRFELREFRPEDGWREWVNEWMCSSPPRGVLIQMDRPEWEKPWIAYCEDVHPEMNVAGLYWRLTGIGKEQVCHYAGSQHGK